MDKKQREKLWREIRYERYLVDLAIEHNCDVGYLRRRRKENFWERFLKKINFIKKYRKMKTPSRYHHTNDKKFLKKNLNT